MNRSKKFAHGAAASRRVGALTLMVTLLDSSLALGVSAEQKQKTQVARLSEDQRILHVLNRLGFGARPGDLDKVRTIGIENYINQQLQPEKIADGVAEARVQNLATLNMTTAELYEKYPQPNQLFQ